MSVVSTTRNLAAKRQVLWTLVQRDLRVRYARSWLGYVWTVLDPLAMSFIYFVVFVFVFKRGDVGHQPYFLFLVIGLLAWQWFNATVIDTARALLAEAKLLRSTNLPREIWVVRVVIAKSIEYLLSLPVLLGFTLVYALLGDVHFGWGILLFPLGVALEFVLLTGVGLFLAPVTALVTDMQRLVRIMLRMTFYMTPILYAVNRVPEPFDKVMWLNPLTGVLELMRAGFFDAAIRWPAVGSSVVMTLVVLFLGLRTFRRLERAVLKEI